MPGGAEPDFAVAPYFTGTWAKIGCKKNYGNLFEKISGAGIFSGPGVAKTIQRTCWPCHALHPVRITALAAPGIY
jgi:hypothetical protein